MERTDWQQQRLELRRRVAALWDQGRCATCYDIESGELRRLFRDDERLIFEDDVFTVILDPYPRVSGHTIVVYKPHRADISELTEAEAATVMAMCVRIIKAIKRGLGAEHVYLLTMSDGPYSHLHLQLFPRYDGDEMGSRRFMLPRAPIDNAVDTVAQIRSALSG